MNYLKEKILSYYLKNKNIFNIKYFLLIPIFGLIFSPPLAYFVSIGFLFVLGRYKISNINLYIMFFTGIAFFSLLISMTSTELFLYEEQDFIGYYNNYLKFLYIGFDIQNFEYGNGIEFILPLINYIFSIILQEDMPYLILFLHSFILLSMLLYIVHLISKKYQLKVQNISLLLAFTLLLYKYGTSLNHLRQAYSTMFILISIFLDKRKLKYLFLIMAIFTHLSSLIIYPIVKFLLLEKSKKKLKLFILVITTFAILFNLFFSLLYLEIMNIDSVVMNKIKFALILVQDNQDISDYLYTTFIGLFYIFILLFILKVVSNKKNKSQWNLYAIIVFTIAFSSFPGVVFRILDPIFTVLFGFLYFKYLKIEIHFKQTYLIGIFLLLFFQFKWVLVNKAYYQKYPLASITPFYYVSTYLENSGFTDRQRLPHRKDIKIENKFK